MGRRRFLIFSAARRSGRSSQTHSSQTRLGASDFSLLGPGVEFLGEISEQEKSQFLGEASGLLFPIDWPEPFGLVMIEAMACGTPVLAFNKGSVAEIVEPGVTGILVETAEEANCQLAALLSLDRRLVRRRFEERFSADRMARNYANLYKRLLMAGKGVASIKYDDLGVDKSPLVVPKAPELSS